MILRIFSRSNAAFGREIVTHPGIHYVAKCGELRGRSKLAAVARKVFGYTRQSGRIVAFLNVEPRTETENQHRFLSADSRLRTILLGLLLVIPTVAIYYPVHTHAFSRLDDYMYVVDNVHVHDGLSWKTVVWAFTALNMANWIPLSWLSHALDYQLFGLNPAGHHLVNVLLHALDVVLLFWVLKRATGYTARSFMVAALFALHPMNVEPVAWVAERKTMLSMVFFLLALECLPPVCA